MNFGTIKNAFTDIYVESHMNGDRIGKETYRKFIKILSENETLKTHFVVYKNIENGYFKDSKDAKEYIEENLKYLDRFRGNKSVVTQSKKLVRLLENSGYEYTKNSNDLNKSLHILTTVGKGIGDLESKMSSKNKVTEHLLKQKNINRDDVVVKENINVDKFLNIATEKYNEKYSNLSEEEKNIVKTIREGETSDKLELLKKLVTETVGVINETLSVCDNITLKSKLLETKDVIYSVSHLEGDLDDIDSNINKVFKIKSVF